MKRNLSFLLLVLVFACSNKQSNIPDIEDQNKIPGYWESREEEAEAPNLPDSYDSNEVEGFLEERDEEEERIRMTDPPLFGD